MQKDYHLRERFGYRLSRLSKLMQGRLDARLAQHSITRLKWCVLSGVGLEGLTSPSSLAENIGVTRPAISRLLKELVADGLVERSLTEQDGRSRTIRLTPMGEDKLTLCLPLVTENQSHFLDKLSPEECEAFGLTLEKLIAGEAEAFDAL